MRGYDSPYQLCEKTTEDIIISHICNTNENHIIYGSCDMQRNRHNFLSFWTIFCPFTPVTNQKIKILKKWKKHLEILSFYTCLPFMKMICLVPEIWSAKDNFFLILDHFWPFYPLKTQRSKISKNWKKHLEILSFYTSAPKAIIICYSVSEIWPVTDVIFSFHFALFFALLLPNSPGFDLTFQQWSVSFPNKINS